MKSDGGGGMEDGASVSDVGAGGSDVVRPEDGEAVRAAVPRKPSVLLKPRANQSAKVYLRRQAENDERKLDLLASLLAEGKCSTQIQMEKVAKRLNLPVRVVQDWRTNSKYISGRVKEKLEALAVLGLAEALPSAVERAKESDASFTALAKVAKMGNPGALVSVTNNSLDIRTGEAKAGDREFVQRFKDHMQGRLEAKFEVVRGNGTDSDTG